MSKADKPSRLAGNILVVASDHLHTDVRVVKRIDGKGGVCGGNRKIDQSDGVRSGILFMIRVSTSATF